jgi:hypothetical protein
MHYDMRNEAHYPGRVGTGPNGPSQPAKDKDQPQDQEQPIAKSQPRRFPDGPGMVASDVRQLPPDNSGSATTGGTTRERPRDTASDAA